MTNKVNRYKDKSKKYFDKKSVNYNDTFDGKYCNLMYESVMKKIKEQAFGSILDVGCGAGAILSMVTGEYSQVKAYGIDFSEKMIEKASGILGPKAQLTVGESDSLPWGDDFFDLVVCNSSFHHYPEPVKTLKEMRRVLAPDGRIIIADPWWTDTVRFLINLYLLSPFNFGGDVRIYGEQEMVGFLAGCGFVNVEYAVVEKKFGIAAASAGKSS
jgi:ubiquinone/menaquinone biosynthesis C-methylase UbiE